MTYYVPYLRKKDRRTVPIGDIINQAIDTTRLYMRTASPVDAAKAIEEEITSRVLRLKALNKLVVFEIGGIPFRLKHVTITAKDGSFTMLPVPDFFSDGGPASASPKSVERYIIPMIRFDKNNLLSITNTGKFVHSRTRAIDYKPEVVCESESLGGLNLQFVITNSDLNLALTDAKKIFTEGAVIATYDVELTPSYNPHKHIPVI